MLGPVLYFIMEGDLHPIFIINLLFKYVDDTNIIVPENTQKKLSFDVLILDFI